MAQKTFDVVVIGAGIAGASVAYELASDARVLVLEREDVAGYHSTGRSASLFNTIGGLPPVKELTIASRDFLTNPPDGFSDTPLLTPRGLLFIAGIDHLEALDTLYDRASAYPGGVTRLNEAEVLEHVSVMRPGWVAAGVWDPNTADLDVHALHQGYLRGLRRRGGELLLRTEVEKLTFDAGSWRLQGADLDISAPIVINAAGAWGDVVAERAGIPGVGLRPLRRSVLTFQPDTECGHEAWPAVIEIEEDFYFKPDAKTLLLSPADETLVPPRDAQPQPLDIAVAVSRFEEATTLRVRKIRNRWAGLRTFVDDGLPVIGFDPLAQGFFWLVGQGGFGIRTSPAASQLAASIVRQRSADDPRFAVRRPTPCPP